MPTTSEKTHSPHKTWDHSNIFDILSKLSVQFLCFTLNFSLLFTFFTIHTSTGQQILMTHCWEENECVYPKYTALHFCKKKKRNHYYNAGQCNYYHKVLRIVHLQFKHFVKNRSLLCIADMIIKKIIKKSFIILAQNNATGEHVKQVLSKLHFFNLLNFHLSFVKSLSSPQFQ